MATEADGERTPSFSRRLRLGQLLAVLAAGPALLITAGVIAGTLAITHQNSVRVQLLEHVEPANAASLRLLTAMVNQETGIRGYELTGKNQFLQPYRLGLQQAKKYERNLRKYAVEGTSQTLAAALRKIDVWESQTAKPAIRRGGAQVANPRTRIDTSLRAKSQFDAIRKALGALQNKITPQVHSVKAELNRSAETTEIAFSVIGFALIISVLSAGLLLRRYVTRPISTLANSARQVASGDLTRSVALLGPQDLELLSEDVDRMRISILRELDTSQRMQEQLADTAADLQRSNTELEQFAYVASHDLQEPLRKVTSFCQLLQERYGSQLDDRADEYIAFAVDGAKRMQQLINDLLSFSRVGRGNQAATPVALNELTAAAIADLHGVIEESGAKVTVGELPTLNVEPALIRTVFQNLIANAIKFRGEHPPRVTLDAQRDGADWLFSCTDNGIGVEPEYADRIFVIFQRLHTREAYPGTGIGLAMCRKIIEHHGGRIWLDQSYPEGTRMYFTLPGGRSTTTSGSLAE